MPNNFHSSFLSWAGNMKLAIKYYVYQISLADEYVGITSRYNAFNVCLTVFKNIMVVRFPSNGSFRRRFDQAQIEILHRLLVLPDAFHRQAGGNQCLGDLHGGASVRQRDETLLRRGRDQTALE